MYEKPSECPVCYEILRTSKPLSCGHWVHKKCIVKSLKNECPICRKEVELTDLEKVEIKYLKGLNQVELQLQYLSTQAMLLKAREDSLIRHSENLMTREMNVIKKEMEIRQLENDLSFKRDVIYKLFCISIITFILPSTPFGGVLKGMLFSV